MSLLYSTTNSDYPRNLALTHSRTHFYFYLAGRARLDADRRKKKRQILPTRCVRLHRSTTSAGIVSTRCGRGATGTRGRMSGARCSLLLGRYGTFVCSFVHSSHFGGLRSILWSSVSPSLCLSIYPPLHRPHFHHPPLHSSHFYIPSSSSIFTSPFLLLLLPLYISPYVYLNNKTLTSSQQLRLRSLPTCRRSTLDGSPQAPRPHRTPSQPGMAQAAATTSQLEEPGIREMPSFNEMVRQAGQSHTTPSALTSPASLAGIVSIAHIRHT